MDRTYIQELKTNIGNQIILKGFIQAIRDQGGIKFLIIRDITGEAQVVVLKSASEVFTQIKELTLESVVEIEGLVKAEKQAPQGIEVQAQKLTVLSQAAPELPIPVVVEKSGEEPDATLRYDWRWLDLRRPDKQKIFKVWTELEKGFRDYFNTHGYTQLYAPCIMNAPSESGAEVFEIKYFDQKAYLAQSPQFYKQMAMAAGFEKVFMVGPVFRAEPSFTTRHMTEFTGWDFEISYIDSHLDIMAEEEQFIVSSLTSLKESQLVDVEIPTTPFPRITVADAKVKLKAANIPSPKIYDLSPEEERELSRLIKEETGHDFVFVTDYHIDVRAFYHMRHGKDNKYTKGFDLIYRGLEITTGAQREHRYDVLKEQALQKGLTEESIKDYLNFFKYGCPPHGGIGFGPGRYVMKILDLPSVKEATYIPRDVKRINP